MAARYPTLPSLAAHICSQGVEERWARITERGRDNEKARRKAGALLSRTLVFQPRRGTDARMPLGI